MKITFIGRTDITDQQANTIAIIAEIITKTGHTIVTTTAPGTNEAVARGVREAGGQVEIRTKDSFQGTDLGIIVTDERIHQRLTDAGILPNPNIIELADDESLQRYCDIIVLGAYKNDIV